MSIREDDNKNEGEIKMSWDKYASTARKSGYRDGRSEGRDKSFQEGFDVGYIEGFKNGFAIGKYKGVICQTEKNCSNANLQHSKRGWCQICTNKDTTFSSTDEIIKKQTEFSNNLLMNLHNTYAIKMNVELHKELDD